MNAPLPSTDVAVVPDLKGKAVLITGASTGIGAAAARAFGRNGAMVALNFNASAEAAETVAADIQAGLKIALARAEVLNCRLNADLSVALRRRARPPTQPVLGCGTVAADWQEWPVGGDKVHLIGLQATVDTSPARFRLTPCYLARVAGVRPLAVPVDIETTVQAFDLPAYVQDPRPDGFTCYVPVVAPFSAVTAQLKQALLEVVRKRWSVTWLGSED